MCNVAYLIEYDLDHQAATRAPCDVVAVPQIVYRNLEAVPARTRVVIYLEGLVVGAVFDLDFVVDGLLVCHGCYNFLYFCIFVLSGGVQKVAEVLRGTKAAAEVCQDTSEVPAAEIPSRISTRHSTTSTNTKSFWANYGHDRASLTLRHCETTMNDVDSATVKLAELLRHPEDLDKIPALKGEFMRKKATIDTQLRTGLKEQLEVTQAGMNSIQDGQRTVNMIKEEMMKIDKLCAEAQNMIQDFPHINLVAQTHRNFEQVEQMRKDIDTFPQRLENLEYLLSQDDEDPVSQPNLLQIHYGLTQLRDIRDKAMQQIRHTADGSTELIDNLPLETGATVQDYFARLDDVVDWFDKHIGEACINLIDLVQSGNDGMVVRLALVIQEEEKQDKKARALQDAQREYKDLAARFKSIATGQTELRGYKEKFLRAIEYVCKARMDEVQEKFEEEPEKLEKNFKWYFNNLNTVKLGMTELMPKKWKIFRTYCNIYHQQMHDFLVERVEDEGMNPVQTLAIINWVDKYYAKMEKLGLPEEDLMPHVVDNRKDDLIRDYRQVIVGYVDQWMDRISANDKKQFLDFDNEAALEFDENGAYRTKGLGDMWQMLGQQLGVAGSSDRTDVTEGVIEAMFRALANHQRMWQTLAEAKLPEVTSTTADPEHLPLLHDWLTAISNDQINCIDDGDLEQDDRASYLTNFEKEINALVSPTYGPTVTAQITSLRNGYIDLATTCIRIFVTSIFLTDFRSVLPVFFTPAWYNEKHMLAMVETFQSYLNEYGSILHPLLVDIFIEEFSDELLAHYLSAVRNKNAKFKRTDQFTEKIRDDVLTAFNFFQQFSNFEDIKNKWRAVSDLSQLIDTDKTQVQFVYADIKAKYWDVQISWVEAVLRSRDDFERSMLNAVKAKAAEINMERGDEPTIFSKVK
jgi:exocyst complex component 3